MLKLVQSAQTESALVQQLEETRRTREWKYSTTLTMIGALHGAVTNPYIGREWADAARRLRPLVKSLKMKHLEKCLRRSALEEETKFPRALEIREVSTLLHRADTIPDVTLRTPLKALIVIAWAFAARIGDALQLRTWRVRLNRQVIVITWMHGKSALMSTQAFTVASFIGAHARVIEELLRIRQGHDRLFPEPVKLRKHLITVLAKSAPKGGKKLELRSFRRGALQQMAKNGVELNTLRLFSRHRDERTLLRYLDWGRFAMINHAATTTAAKALWSNPVLGVGGDGSPTSKLM
jgi:hypothetical protein